MKTPNQRLFRQLLIQWFWDTYDYLLKLLLMNIAMFVLLFGSAFLWFSFVFNLMQDSPPRFLMFAVLLTVVFLGPIWLTLWFAPLNYFGELVSKEKDPGWREFFTGLQLAGPRTWKYFQFCCIILGILLVNLWFYLYEQPAIAALGSLRFFLAGLSFWIGFFFTAVMIVGIPITVRQRQGVVSALKIAGVVVLRYPGVIAPALAWLLILWLLCGYLRMVGVILFGLSWTALFLNSLYDVILEFEEEQEKERNPDPEPRNWAEVKEQEAKKEIERMNKERYRRTMKDILRPWDDN